MPLGRAKIAGIVSYLAFVGALGFSCVQLAGFAGSNAIAMAAPHFTVVGERPLNRVERRSIVVAQATGHAPGIAASEPLTLEAPAIPAGKLAAQLDVVEGADLVRLVPPTRRMARARTRDTKPARVAAADVFGRSFGVMLMASR